MDTTLNEKLIRLLRYHRQRVFDANGDRHHRALLRLKASATAKALFSAYAAESRFRHSERLLRAYA